MSDMKKKEKSNEDRLNQANQMCKTMQDQITKLKMDQKVLIDKNKKLESDLENALAKALEGGKHSLLIVDLRKEMTEKDKDIAYLRHKVDEL